MKKFLLSVAALFLAINVNLIADDYNTKNEATQRIVRSVEEGRGVCRDANGNRGTYQTTGYTRTTTTSSSNSSSNSNGYSNSSSTSSSASASLTGPSISGSMGVSSSNNRSQTYGNSTTTTTSTSERVECVPFSK